MPFYILDLIIAFCCVIHVFKTGQDRYWIYIVIILPVAGFLAYLLMVVLPGLLNSRQGYKVTNKIKKILNPQAELKEALKANETAETYANQKRLGDAYLGVKEYQQALMVYLRILKGLYATDPELLLQIAKCYYHLGNADECLNTLTQLKTHNPDFHTAIGHLYYAKALALKGDKVASKHEYQAIIQYYPGFDARVSYAEDLLAWGDLEEAKALLQTLSREVKRSERHVRELNEESVKRMKQLLTENQW